MMLYASSSSKANDKRNRYFCSLYYRSECCGWQARLGKARQGKYHKAKQSKAGMILYSTAVDECSCQRQWWWWWAGGPRYAVDVASESSFFGAETGTQTLILLNHTVSTKVLDFVYY